MKTADPELMRAINRFHVMDAIRRFGPVSRVEISQLTELSPTTVSAITAALLDDRLIIPLQVGAVRDAGRGRPRVMLKLNPDAAHVVGVKLAPDQITVAVTNFCADIVRSLALPIRLDRQTAAVIADLVEDGVRRCVSDAGLDMAQISGVCVGLPGVVERAAGVCRQSPILQERDVPFGADLSHRLGVPASIDSDVNLVTLAEHWFGQARDLNDFLVVNVERSLGLGILHNGELFRGANGLSPDLGDLMVRSPRGGGERLADVASEASVLIEAEALLGEGGHASLRQGRAMAFLLKRADDGDERCLARARRRRRGAGLRDRQPHRAVRAAQGHHLRPRHGDERPFRRAAAQDRRGPPAGESRGRVRHRRARMERRKLGARRRGDDAARPLWRALGHDWAGADSRAHAPQFGEQ